MTKTLIAIPTFNEVENVTPLFFAINKLNIDADVLFVDDNSPDGTSQAIESLMPLHPRLVLIKRQGKLGIGSAHQFIIEYAYQKNYDVLLTMDADFTHSPSEIPNFLSSLVDNPVVIGSRHLKMGSLQEWSLHRKFLTKLGHFLTTFFLGIDEDATGAFRAFRLKAIPRELFKLVESKSYSFFFESLFILKQNKFKIKEIPIDLPARTYGHSKMNLKDIITSLKFLGTLYVRKVVSPGSFRCLKDINPELINHSLYDIQNWDEYWMKKKSKANFAYDLIAAFYRKFIIRPMLNDFILNNFTKDHKLLHAGCGSGQVDVDITPKRDVRALDISVEALKIYKIENETPDNKLIHGSIFQIPVLDNSIDGIYNLGVMEHFHEPEIQKILSEFKRILKSKGKIVLFWPPEKGSSVIFLKFVHWIIKNIFSSDLKLHPDEVCRLSSKKHAEKIINEAGFKFKSYHFGMRDFFTYSVVIAEKAD